MLFAPNCTTSKADSLAAQNVSFQKVCEMCIPNKKAMCKFPNICNKINIAFTPFLRKTLQVLSRNLHSLLCLKEF